MTNATTPDPHERAALEAELRAQAALIARLHVILAQREQALAALSSEAAAARADSARVQRSRFYRAGVFYWSIRYELRAFLLRVLPGALRERLRPHLERPAATPAPAPLPAPDPDFYDHLTLRPGLTELQRASVLAARPLPAARRPDVICFSIIDWDFRYQRPQQIMSQFAAAGHRVFYFNLTQPLPPSHPAPFQLRRIKPNVFELFVRVPRPLAIYSSVLDSDLSDTLLACLGSLTQAYHIHEAIGYVMVAGWGQVALEARRSWGWRLIYDCMDEWDTFPGFAREVVDAEAALVQACDLLVVTGQRLYEKWHARQGPVVLARNGVDYDFYAARLRPNSVLTRSERPLVGYYGAIAEWVDVELVRHAAEQRPGYDFVLLGGVFDVDVSGLEALPNVKLLGQQPYETMPAYLYHFDACLIPFKINAITQATDPVKLYEYLSAGKPVVATNLAELQGYCEHLYLADSGDDFVAQLDAAVAERDPERAERRRSLARSNTWRSRYDAIYAAFRRPVPRASIVVVTYNNLAYTRLCLESILRNTAYPDYELIVVDNASSDGTPAYLQTLAAQHDHIQLVLNPTNEGFARANNQGLALAAGEYLVLLNNDTVVPPGWLSRLTAFLQDPAVGLVGPVTNFVGNEANVEVTYQTWGEMEAWAQSQAINSAGRVADLRVLAMYCVALRRDVYAALGPLDEQFGIGMFEDDDYAMRARQAGYRVICAPEVFVHHFGQAAFRQLIADGTYDELFETNRRRYEDKWQVVWETHTHGALEAGLHRPGAALPAGASYADQVQREKEKWGQHLQVEASGEWHAWLDHPLVRAHYAQRALIDGRPWPEWVVKQLGGPAARSLDLGCGAGETSLLAWRAGATSYLEGLDLSDDRVAEGERRREAAGAPGRFWVEDVNQVVLPEAAYDLIFSAHSFHHFLRLEHVLAQVARALTPRGFFVLEEYVGPTQFQWTEQQMALTRELLSLLPASRRRYRDGRLKVLEGRPTPEEVVAVSPFESIRSGEIGPLFERFFTVVAVRPLGGTLQHLLYNGIMHNFQPQDEAGTRYVRAILAAEDSLIDGGLLPSDFRLLVGRRKDTPPSNG